MSLSLNLTGIRATATQISPRSAAVVGKTPGGVSVKFSSPAGDLASPRKQYFDAGTLSVSARKYSTQLNAQPRIMPGEKKIAAQKFGATGAARLYSTGAGASASGNKALAEAKQFLEDYRCGRVENLSDIYPPEDREFAIWFQFNVPPKFADVPALRPVAISPEAMSAFERRMEAKIDSMPPGDPKLKAALGDMVKEFVRGEAAKPENRNLFGVTPETRMSILDRDDLEPEKKAVMFVFLGDLKEWGYLKGGEADRPAALPSLSEASRFLKGAFGFLGRELKEKAFGPEKSVVVGLEIDHPYDGGLPKLRPERLQAALENAEKFAGMSIPYEPPAPRPENDLRARAREYAQAAFAENSRDKIPEGVKIWAETTNAGLPAGLPPVSPSRMLGRNEWAQIQEALEAEFSAADKALTSESGSDLPASIKKAIDFYAQFASADNWEDLSYQVGYMFDFETEYDDPAQSAAAKAIGSAIMRKYTQQDRAGLPSWGDMDKIADIAKDLARRGY
jgi:hypothetical protein